MKVLLDIKDSKADFILELLNGFPSYVKAKSIPTTKVQLKENKQRKIKLKNTPKFVKTFSKEQKDWWDELTETQQKEIDQSIAEMRAGKLTPHTDVMKKYKKWMKK